MSKLQDHLPYAIRQFETDIVVPLQVLGVDVSISTATTAKLTTIGIVVMYLTLAMRERSIVPGRLQASAELLYGFVSRTVLRIAGPEGAKAIPFIFSMYVFILFGTLLGLTPIKETFTSHLIVTLALALMLFAYVNVLAFRAHGLTFFRHFLPPGVPIFVAPVLVLVEVVSYLFRPITLGFRIFANIFAGHVMLKLFADFATMLVAAFGNVGVALAVLPVAVMVVLIGVEIAIVIIQSYIFMLISTIYLKDSLRAHHD